MEGFALLADNSTLVRGSQHRSDRVWNTAGTRSQRKCVTLPINTLIPANSDQHLVFADYINDREEIARTGVPPGVPREDVETLGHAYLLVSVSKE